VSRGMLIAIGPKHWRAAAELDDEAWRAQLLDVARTVDVKRYFTEPRNKKKSPAQPVAPLGPKARGGHLATQRILDQAKQPKS
ncbi:MAG: hypothetical protein K8U03_04790, partial [Planctomycetia bacterium]|nr:hypothetical protein [Planctomycetia bacterium]